MNAQQKMMALSYLILMVMVGNCWVLPTIAGTTRVLYVDDIETSCNTFRQNAGLLSQIQEKGGGDMPPPSIRFRVSPSPKGYGIPFIFSPDGKLLAIPTKQSVKLYDSTSGAFVAELVPQDRWREDWIGNIRFSADSNTLAANTVGGDRIRIWDIKTLKQKALISDVVRDSFRFDSFSGHRGQMIAVVPKAKIKTRDLIIGAKDEKIIEVWDIVTGQMKKAFELPNSRTPLSMEFSPDGKTLIISSAPDLIFVYDTASWKVLASLKKLSPDSSPVIGFIFSPDSQLVAMVGISSIVTIQDMETYEIRSRLVGHKSRIEDVAFSPDGEMVATISDDKTIKVWDVATGQLKKTLTESSGTVRFISFSPDGRFLSISGAKREKVELIDVTTWKIIATLDSRREAHAVFSPDGQSLAVSNKDGSVTVWDISAM